MQNQHLSNIIIEYFSAQSRKILQRQGIIFVGNGFEIFWYIIAALGALLGTSAELLSPGEWDTVSVPVSILLVLLLMIR